MTDSFRGPGQGGAGIATNHGFIAAIVAVATIGGNDGSTTVLVAAALGSGLPKSGAATAGPCPVQLAKFFTISDAAVAGSMSPDRITTVFSGRYQRSWNACTAAGVAASSVLIVPIGERLASG